ncbi:hypothetical protein [Acidovorax sp.]|uniref:helix-turn-helix domain-containing protein n=1 Tax=Acidovorax sp. TaxID=1872122 RepID=UPI002ACDF0E4|nr:hypothetical protein [Acidovorax sp.]MDZ7862099.1 hypothetical protein [Acidovorax sp.]
MTQKELAALLGISGAAVSKLVKRGMPTDSLERAKRWRKRHLEPGRVKGAKFDPAAPAMSPAEVLIAEAERLAVVVVPQLVDAGSTAEREQILGPLRAALRLVPTPHSPTLPAAAWVELLQYAVADDALLRVAKADEPLQSAGVGALVSAGLSDGVQWPPSEALRAAGDWTGWASSDEACASA